MFRPAPPTAATAAVRKRRVTRPNHPHSPAGRARGREQPHGSTPRRTAAQIHSTADRARQGAVNVRFPGAAPQGSGPPNRHGMPQLPVGQHEVKNWPVLDLGEQPDVADEPWTLEIGGLVENPFTLDWDAVPGAAAGRRRQRLPLRDDLEPLRQPLARRPVHDDRGAGRAARDGALRPVHRLRPPARQHTSPTRPTCRSRARSTTTCCWCTPGKDSRCRASTAARAG